MEQQQNTSGVQIGHLLQLQETLTRNIHEAIDRHHVAVERRVTELIDAQKALAEYQRVANGRMTRLELAHARLRTRVDRGSSFLASMSRTQKAKLAAAAAVLIPLGVEAVQRLLPVLIAFLVRIAGVPPPPVAPDPPPPISRPTPDTK